MRTFFLENTCACPWSLASSIPVLGLERVCLRKGCPWPKILFVSLASDLVCVLDSTSSKRFNNLICRYKTGRSFLSVQLFCTNSLIFRQACFGGIWRLPSMRVFFLLLRHRASFKGTSYLEVQDIFQY